MEERAPEKVQEKETESGRVEHQSLAGESGKKHRRYMERFAIDSETDLPILFVELACCREETRETKKKAVGVNLSRDRSSYPC